MDAVLETRSLCKSFGALTVAQNIDFRLRPGERHALIGPNGAGKTTFVNMLMGALRPSSGRILLGGDDVTRAPQAQRVKRGLGRTFQINSLFRNLPVLDNVALAVAERRRIALRMWRAAGSYKEIIEESTRSEEHTSELQSLTNIVCRLLLEKKKKRHAKRRELLQRINQEIH